MNYSESTTLDPLELSAVGYGYGYCYGYGYGYGYDYGYGYGGGLFYIQGFVLQSVTAILSLSCSL